ncbi:Retrovirus-related Pol polyprotein from transposon RE2 [Sesamum angolense]|uniref:Retrovirus-related Pol polyprotein from transposon RE2 n=1 Tax=Sesamum angolense TaxID=2727404 RepID=A0AAE1WQ73_9LAMI|nr:Retrovirus-related Pol polyprotein from transposon RE2 [Sesamum angolense]
MAIEVATHTIVSAPSAPDRLKSEALQLHNLEHPDMEDITDDGFNPLILDISPHTTDQTSPNSVAPITVTSPLPYPSSRPLKHSTRHVQKLAWMFDFVCNHHSTFSTTHLLLLPNYLYCRSLVYVDDILIMGPAEALIIEVKDYLDALFSIKDLLGWEIARFADGMSVTQRKYINDIITDTRMIDAHSALIPLPQGAKFGSNLGAPLYDPEKYRRLIGRLLYPCYTRLDLSFTIQQLSQFLKHPTDQHWTVTLAHCEKTKRQNMFSHSSAKAKYHAMAASVYELPCLLRDFQIPVATHIPFLCDNQAALHITANPIFHERTKHLDIDCHVIRDKYK